jgi:tRNA A37 threonylcarbamoyladenosine biosynthesis protein TsaE
MQPWYTQLEFSENPLDARPNAHLIGMEEQEQQLKNFIAKEELCFLNGLTGAGKTSLLKRIQEIMPEYAFIYLDADALPATFNLTEALRGKRTLFDMIRLKELPTKKTVLIIDEFQATDPKIVLEARSKWENPTERHIKSIIIAQISEQLKNVPGSFKDRLGNRVIRLAPLNNDVMRQVLEKRLENKKTLFNYYNNLSPQAIDFLIAVADGNVRRLLEYTDLVFDFHYQRFKDSNPLAHSKEYKVTFPAVKEILTVNNIPIDAYVPEVMKKTEKPEVKKEESVQEKAEQKPVQTEEKEPPRVTQTFDKEFTLAEQNVLRSLARHEPMTLKQVATDIHLEINKCNGVIANLKKKNAIVSTTRTSGEKSWQMTESAKRAMVVK